MLLSQATVDRVRDRLPAAVSVQDLGTVRLKDLASPEHVYQLVHPQLRREFPAMRSLEATPNNLPQQISSFVGRELDLVEVRRLLRQSRLVTLVGIGGIGKTRMSLHVAADTLDDYPDGVWFVELGPITDPGLVPSAVAHVLGLQVGADVPLVQTLCSHLKSRRLLLTLDNCEHLLRSCADLAEALLATAPDLRVLASSREPLNISGEQVMLLPPLGLPDGDSGTADLMRAEAVELFVERVRLQRPDFVVTEQKATAIAELCTHLDGIPVALELAAALVPVLAIEEINARLGPRKGGTGTSQFPLRRARATVRRSHWVTPYTEEKNGGRWPCLYFRTA